MDGVVSKPLRLRLLVSLIAIATTLAPAAPAFGQTQAPAQAPLAWAAPFAIDSNPISGLACPAPTLCVAIDNAGGVLTSTAPAAGAGAWTVADVDGANALTSVSCPTRSLCVATDAAGNVVTSTNPTGGAAAWTVSQVDKNAAQPGTDGAGPLLRGISCPSVSFCVAVDSIGDSVFSTNPIGGAGAWSIADADLNTASSCSAIGFTCQAPLMGVSCPAISLCSAVDFSGNVLVTTAPAGQAPWATTFTDADGSSSLWGIACPSSTLCVTVDGFGGRVITWNPTHPQSVATRQLPVGLFGIWCPSASLCLALGATAAGTSELLGSTNPGAPLSTWTATAFGGVNAIACPTPSLCIAGDDQGNVAAGLATRSIAAHLRQQLLPTQHLPSIRSLLRSGSYARAFASPLAGRLVLTWTSTPTVAQPGSGTGTPVVIAAASARFAQPGTLALRLTLTGAGRRMLKRLPRLSLTASAAFAATAGGVSVQRQLTLTGGSCTPVRKRGGKVKRVRRRPAGVTCIAPKGP